MSFRQQLRWVQDNLSGENIMLIFFVVSLVSCTLPPMDWQTRWLRGIPCRLPCWEGVTPGKTTASEAVEILRKSPIISTVIMHDSNSYYNGGINWMWVAGGLGGSAYYNVHIPEHTIIWIRLSLPPFTLSQVIQAYGEPNYVVARRLDNIEARETGRTIYDLHFVYMSNGFMLSKEQSYQKPSFNTNDTFTILTVFAPNPPGFSEATQIEPDFLSSWEGFKDYDFYCKDERSFKSCD